MNSEISTAEKPTLKRKFITLDEKIKILDRLRSGEKALLIAKSFSLNESTIRTIKQNENKIRNSVIAGSSISTKRVARVRNLLIEKMEKALMLWIEDCATKKMPISTNAIKTKALKIYVHLKESNSDAVLVTKTSKQEFLASKGWFENFKSRFGLHNIKVQGETGSADVEAAKVYPKTLAKIIEEGRYKGEQIFNADETGLNWRKMPRRTYISKNDGCDDMNEDDIYEIMNEGTDLIETDLIHLTTESPSVSNLAQDDVTSVEDICESIPSFTLKRIREGLSLVEKMKSFFTTNDPSLERSSKIIRKIDINLAPYYEIEKELKKTTHQKLITDFAIIKPVEEPQGPTTSVLSNSENYVEEISSDEAIGPPKRSRAKIFEDNGTD